MWLNAWRISTHPVDKFNTYHGKVFGLGQDPELVVQDLARGTSGFGRQKRQHLPNILRGSKTHLQHSVRVKVLVFRVLCD